MPRRGLVSGGGRKPQMRRASPKSWSASRAKEFLSALAETLNVSEACRVSKLATGSVYRRRKSDAAFRAGWNDAVAEGFRRLELVLLERAFVGVEKVIRRRDGSEEIMREYPNEFALRLLKFHHETARDGEAEWEMPAEEVSEIRERLIRKLQRLKKRNEQDAHAAAPGTVERNEAAVGGDAAAAAQADLGDDG